MDENTNSIYSSVDDATKAELERVARADHRTVSGLIRVLVVEGLQRRREVREEAS